MDDGAHGKLHERTRIVDVITTLFVATDRRDWPTLQECFDSFVTFDMTSMSGGSPLTRGPAEIAAGWEAGLAPIESVHHQLGNFAVDVGDGEATATCYGIAYHYRRTASGRNTRTFVGSYDFHLRRDGDRWLIDVFRFHLKFLDGNLELESEPGP